MIFIAKTENGKTTKQGYCIKCANELGIGQVSEILKQIGLTQEDLESMDQELDGLMQASDGAVEPSMAGDEENNAPAIDFGKLFGQFGKPDGGKSQPGKGKKPAGGDGKKERRFLKDYCTDLTGAAREGKLDRVIGREKELLRVVQILMRRQKNNPCLIGEPGVGKTAIAEALAQKIVAGDVPYKLRDKEVFVLDLAALVAGTQFRGQFEGRMKGLIEEIKREGNIILMIDEVHSIVGAGDAEGSMNAANIMKPALSRGDVHVIGATTLAEYRKYIESDSALERRFQPVTVAEPSVSDTVKILQGIKQYYEDYHGIIISDDVIERAVVLSERYITDRFLPDKAIDLVDEAASYLAATVPLISRYDEENAKLEKTAKARAALEEAPVPEGEENTSRHYEELARLKCAEMQLSESVKSMEKERRGIYLTVSDLAKVIEIWTGIPSGNITEGEFEKLARLEDTLKSRIIGQDKAVNAVVRAVKRNRAGVEFKKKPVSFIFAGPTGVGKTELVKQLARELFDSPEDLIRLDMSEYMEKHSVSKMIGSPPGYVGYDEAGQLTEKIRRRPYSVILFDEIEKAHPDVLNILLQMLDDGRVTDAHGREVDFSNTVIVMSTNAGSTYSTAPAGFVGAGDRSLDEAKTEKALSDFLRPEFINRVDEIITFNSLTVEDFKGIVRIMMGEFEAALKEKGIALEYTDALCEYVVENSYSRKFGARNMRRYIESHIQDKAAEIIISRRDGAICAIVADVVDGQISVEAK